MKTKKISLNDLLTEMEDTNQADVRSLGKAQQTAKTVLSKAKRINNVREFNGAFAEWFKTLGIEPGKVPRATLRSSVDKILQDLGFN